MNEKIATFVFILTLGHSAAIQCDLPEKCTYGNLLSSLTTQSYVECLTQCKNLFQCGFVTFFDQIQVCELFEDCQETEACDSCTSGEVQCPNFSCDLQGLCLVSVCKNSVFHDLEFFQISRDKLWT